MTNALTQAQPMNQMLGFRFVSIDELSAEQKAVLKDTVAKKATDTELAYFLNVAFAQELDPFRKEVWCVKYGDSLMIQTSRDGFLKIAKRDPTFDRIQSAEVREGDVFRMDPISGQIEHRIEAKRGAILGAYAVITRKDGTKLSKYVTFAEYRDDSSTTWKGYPSAMICKCAESVLCKQFANVTGIVAEETMRKDGSVIDSSPAAQEQQSCLSDELIQKIRACATRTEFETLRNEIAGVAGKLFGDEKDAVFVAAKAKKAELEAIDIKPSEQAADHETGTAEVVAAEIVPSAKSETTAQMPPEEFTTWIDGIKNQETTEGIADLLAAAADKWMLPEQRSQLEEAAAKAKAELQKDQEKRMKPKKK